MGLIPLSNFSVSRKGMVQLGKYGLSILFVFLFGYFIIQYVIPALAGQVNPGTRINLNESNYILNQPVWVNVTPNSSASNYNGPDFFYYDGNTVWVVANFTSLSFPNGVNATELNVSGNFTSIGGSANALARGLGNGIYTVNGTVSFSTLATGGVSLTGNNMFYAATIRINGTNATNATDYSLLNMTVVLVNMTTMPGCPPNVNQVPPAIPLLNGTLVIINDATTCITTCSADDVAERNATSGLYHMCGPGFGGSTTNFSTTASTGNFESVPLVIDIPGKVKINFTTGVNMSDADKAGAIMQFAMKNMMSGGRLGVNETEWNGSAGKPNMAGLSAELTIYNFSGRFNLPATSTPSISYRSVYGTDSFSVCPASVCSGFRWDGQNLTFTVTGFSEYSIERGLSVVLNSPANYSNITTRTINFTYTPTWNATTTVKNATLYTNSTGSWVANTTNATPLVNATVNGITLTVAKDSAYLWNVVLYDTLGGSDTNTLNWTVTVDTVAPVLTSPIPANKSYIRGTSAQTFSIAVSESGSEVRNGTVYYKNTTQGAYSSSALTSCTGINPTCIVNVDLFDTGTYPDGATVQYYFEVYDYAGQTGYSGTSDDPLTVKVDRTTPKYSAEAPNRASPQSYTSSRNYGFQITWTDTVGINDTKVIFESNFTGTSTNYSSSTTPAVSNSTPSIFTINFTQEQFKGAYGYVYRWFANDTADNINSSFPFTTYTINKADPSSLLTLTIDGDSSSTQTREYGNTTMTNGSTSITGQSDVNYTLLRNGTVQATGPAANQTIKLGATAHNYTFNTTGGMNFTDGKKEIIVTVSKSAANITLSLSPASPITYETQITAFCGGTNNTDSPTTECSLWRDGVNVTSENNTAIYLGNATHNYTANISETANFTSASTSQLYIVQKKTPLPTLTLTATSGTYPLQTTTTCGGGGIRNEVYLTLYRNTTNVTATENNTAVKLGVGDYLYNCSVSTYSANYSYNETTNTLSISQNTTNVITLYLNSSAANRTYERGAMANFSAIISLDYSVTLNLSTNITGWGSDKTGTNSVENITDTSNVAATNGNASYNITAFWTGDVNYSAMSRTYYTWVQDTAYPKIDFTGSTPANKTNTTSTTLVINVSINETYPDTYILYLNGTANQTGSYSATNAIINLTNTSLSEATWRYYIWANDTAGNANQTGTRVITIDATAPTLSSPTPANNTYISGSSTQTFSIVASDTVSGVRNGTVYYKNSSQPTYSSATLTSCTGVNPTCSANVDLSNTGTYPDGVQVRYYFEVGDYAGNVRYYGGPTDYLRVTVDRSKPKWSANATSVASGSVYTPSRNYGFEVNWTNTAAGIDNTKVIFESNFTGTSTNYSSSTTPAVSNSTPSIFTINFTQEQFKGAYGYVYRWFANDTADNINSTDQWTYTINKAGVNINIFINSGAANTDNTITYPTQANATAVINISAQNTFTLYRNGTSVGTQSADKIEYLDVLGARGYNFTASYSETENYSAFTRSSINLTVSKGNPTSLLSLVVDGSSAATQSRTYGNNTRVVGSETVHNDTDMGYSLFRNGTNVTSSEQNVEYRLNASGWNYTYATAGGANWTNGQVEISLTINKGTVSITLFPASNRTETYPFSIAPYCGSNATETKCTLWRDETNVTATENNTEILYAVGTITFVANVTATENYTNSSMPKASVIINRGNPINNMTLTIDGSSAATQSRTYGNSTRVTGSDTNLNDIGGVYTLYRNGTNVNTTENATQYRLNASTWNYTYAFNGSANWTNGQIERMLTINPGSVNVTLSVTPASPIVYSVQTTASCGTNATETKCSLFRNQVNVTASENNTAITLGNATYNYTANVTATENYTTSSVTLLYTVWKSDTNITLSVTPASPITYETQTTAFCGGSNNTDISGPKCSLWLDNTNVTANNNTAVYLGNATYTITANITESANFSSSSVSLTYRVNNATPKPTLSGITNGTYPTAQTIYCGVSSRVDEVKCTTYRNGTNVTNENNTAITVGAGLWNYTTTTPQTGNYSANTTGTEVWLNINKGTVTAIPYSNITSGTYPEQPLFRVYSNATETNPTLWINTTSNITNLNNTAYKMIAGRIILKANITETGNYSSFDNTTTVTIDLSQGISNITLFLNGANNNASIEQGTTANFTATINTTYNVGFNLTYNITGSWWNRTTIGTRIENTTSTNNINVGSFVNVTAYFDGDQNFSSDSETLWMNITPDVTAPAVLVLVYTNATINKSTGSVTMNISISDTGVGLTGNCMIAIGGIFAGNITRAGSSASGTCNGTVTIPAASNYATDRNYTLQINISDANGRNGTNTSYVVQIDNTPPIITISVPTNGTYNKTDTNTNSTGTFQISGTISDNLQMGTGNISVNNTNFTVIMFNGVNNTVFAINNTIALSGSYYGLRINYTDNATNTQNVTVNFYVDNETVTSVSGLMNSTLGTYQSNASQTVQVRIIDNLQTNRTITLYYRLNSTWLTGAMTGTPGTTTVYTATISTVGSHETSGGISYVPYYITGIDNATNNITNGGSQAAPLTNLTINTYCGNNGAAWTNGHCSGNDLYDTGWKTLNSFGKTIVESFGSLGGNFTVAKTFESVSGTYNVIYSQHSNGTWTSFNPSAGLSLSSLQQANDTTITKYWFNMTSPGVVRINPS